MAEYTISKASDNKATAGVAATASPTAMASKNTVSSAGSQAGSYGSGASVVSNTNSNGNGRNGNGNNNGNNQYSRGDTSPDAGPPARVGRIEVIPAETESPHRSPLPPHMERGKQIGQKWEESLPQTQVLICQTILRALGLKIIVMHVVRLLTQMNLRQILQAI